MHQGRPATNGARNVHRLGHFFHVRTLLEAGLGAECSILNLTAKAQRARRNAKEQTTILVQMYAPSLPNTPVSVFSASSPVLPLCPLRQRCNCRPSAG